MTDFTVPNALRAKLTTLEERAGIAEQVADANLGPQFPNFRATTEEYFDETEDYARARVRDLYFGVGDLELRKQLIHVNREWRKAYGDMNRKDLAEARKELVNANRGVEWFPWISAAIVAATCVALGAKYFGLYGAIAGALAGFFIGHGVVASKKKEQAGEIARAAANVREAEESLREHEVTPDWFNDSEERTGERDARFDDESVTANRARESAPS
jgi:hypothetical protein